MGLVLALVVVLVLVVVFGGFWRVWVRVFTCFSIRSIRLERLVVVVRGGRTN